MNNGNAGAAPRVTPEDIENEIQQEYYFTAKDGVRGRKDNGFDGPDNLQVLTFCVLELKNGYLVHGISACAHPKNYNREIGERIARENAVDQIWPLLGYELKTKIHETDRLSWKRILKEQVNRIGSVTGCDASSLGSKQKVFAPEEADKDPNVYLDFGQAVKMLRAGCSVARKGWNGKGMWLKLQMPDDHSKMSLPYIYMKTADDKQVPWLASQTDMLSEDWLIVEGYNPFKKESSENYDNYVSDQADFGAAALIGGKGDGYQQATDTCVSTGPASDVDALAEKYLKLECIKVGLAHNADLRSGQNIYDMLKDVG
jgi:hypothetical protein